MKKFSNHIRASDLFSIAFLLIAILISAPSYSQGRPQFVLDHNEIIISVNNIAAQGEITIRDLTAHFPWPILSTISVVDSAGDIITGLADTSRWLKPGEIAENGMLISDIWKPLLEYHEENTEIPPDPDLYRQKPEPLITEIRTIAPLSVCTMLVMDVSESMIEEIEEAKEGVRSYVRLFRPNDRGGIIQFESRIVDFLPMTNDTSALIEKINSATPSGGTAIYDALIQAIEMIKCEIGRRSIIIYTDGDDRSSLKATAQSVIDSARANNLPIHTIALGVEIEHEEILKMIADQTNGLFFKAVTVEEMKDIYGKLSIIMHNYYVMAHASPDPEFNQTWRLVDVTANLPGLSGRSVGRYYVPGPLPQFFTDLEVNLASKTDTTIVAEGDTISGAKPGEVFDYIIRYKNYGPDRAENVSLKHFLPDDVIYNEASIPPQPGTENYLEWLFPAIMPGVDDSIIVTVKLSDEISLNVEQIISRVEIYAPADTSLENNADSETIRVIFPDYLKQYDLEVTQTVTVDTAAVIEGKIYDAVVQGESYSYQIRIVNTGPAPALNFTLWDVFPDFVTLSQFNINWTEQKGDTLLWVFPYLAMGDTLIVSCTATVALELPYHPFPLVNISGLIAEHDSQPENNIDTTTVYGIARQKPLPLQTDLSLALTSITARKTIVDGDTINAVMPGETFQYQITVANLGMNPADTVNIVHELPAPVIFLNSSPEPLEKIGNSLRWEFLNWQPAETKPILVNVQLAESIPPEPDIIISQAILSSSADTTIANNTDSDTIKVIFEEPPPVGIFDLSIDQVVTADTTIVVGDESFPAVFAGESYRYALIVTNIGPDVAAEFEVWDVIPNSVTFYNFDVPVVKQEQDTIFWRVNSLAAGDTVKINFDALVAQELPFSPFPLINEAGIIVRSDTAIQSYQDTSIVYAIKKFQPSAFATDLELKMFSITDSIIIINQDTSNVVFPGENYQYFISVHNNGPYQADSVRLVHTLPDFVSFTSATVTPESSLENSLVWEFDFLEPFKAVEIIASVKLADQIPPSLTQLFSQAEIFAQNDSTTDNNIVTDSVQVRFPETPPTERSFNLAVQQEVFPDTTIIIAGESKDAVFRGATYNYKIQVDNFGPVAAKDFSIWDLPPDSVSMVGHSFSPTKIVNDTLFWQIDWLDVGETLTIDLEAKVTDTLPFTPFPLLNRVGLIAKQDTVADDNFSEKLAYAIARPDDPLTLNADISVSQYVQTDSFSISNNDTVRFARAGETYLYLIKIFNESPAAAMDVVVTDVIPDSVSASNYRPTPKIVAGDSITWHLGYLLPQETVVLQFNATVRSQMPVGRNLLINRVTASASNEDPARLSNNTSITTVINLVKPVGDWQPLIEATPPKVKVGSNIRVRVQTPVPVESWDIWVYLADGKIDREYGDPFIAVTELVPNQWIEIDPQYVTTQMYSAEDKEPLIFELRVVDVFGELKIAQAIVEIESEDDFVVDRNSFVPDQENELPIKFKISSDRVVRLEIYDITGTRISRLTESQFKAGWNTYRWDGLTENGQKIGSGFYILTIHSGEYNAWKKLIIVR